MSAPVLYPLFFEPIYQYRLWGGRRLADLLSAPLPVEGPVGEAWLLSDRHEFPSKVSNGALSGHTIGQVLEEYPEQLLGKFVAHYDRFPLLLKFLDAQEMLSVQVHPSDTNKDLLPVNESGKTEAWVVLEAAPGSRIYAGLKPGTTADNLRQASTSGNMEDFLQGYNPLQGDGFFIPAGTVHAMGGDVVVFEIQQNSDVTFHLYDWDHIDPKTGKPRPLQIEKAISCINFTQTTANPVKPVLQDEKPAMKERLFLCKQFGLWRLRGDSLFITGEAETPRVLVCIEGEGQLEHEDQNYTFRKGDVILLPAVVGACFCRPRIPVTLLEISFPEGP